MKGILLKQTVTVCLVCSFQFPVWLIDKLGLCRDYNQIKWRNKQVHALKKSYSFCVFTNIKFIIICVKKDDQGYFSHLKKKITKTNLVFVFNVHASMRDKGDPLWAEVDERSLSCGFGKETR